MDGIVVPVGMLAFVPLPRQDEGRPLLLQGVAEEEIAQDQIVKDHHAGMA